MNKGTKIKDFVAALEMGETREAARDIAGCSDATSKIQYAKWKSSKGETVAKAPKKAAAKKAIPKAADKKKKTDDEDVEDDDIELSDED